MVTEEHHRNRILSSAYIVTASLALFLAQSAYWINHTVFNQENFTTITTTELTKDSSRDAIATAVVDRALEDRPIAKRVAGDRATQLTSGLLGSDASVQAIRTLSDKTYAYVTSPDREDVTIDLTSLHTFLGALIAIAETQGAGQKLEAAQANIPQEIVLLKSDSFPDLSGVVTAMLWLGPLFWLITFAGYGAYAYINRNRYVRALYMVGLAVTIVSLFGLALSPFIPAPLAAAIPSINLRPVAENLITGFLEPFRMQMLYTLIITGLAMLILNQRHTILRAINATSSRISQSSTPAPKAKKIAKKQ